jgi:multicomponent Na+:H+ antiporter subunit G
MNILLEAFTILFVVLGTGFSIVAIVGFYRLPDVYTRLHAASKVGVFGVVLLVTGFMFVAGNITKSIILIGLLILTIPLVSHALASAAYRIGLKMRGSVMDDLADYDQK